MRTDWFIAVVASAAMLSVSEAHAQEAGDFFEAKIRPLLVARCFECHGDNEPEAGLRLTSRESILQGGDSGPAAVVGRAAESLLVDAIQYQTELRMPPNARLSATEVAAVEQWIDSGMDWPVSSTAVREIAAERMVTEADREHWSFQPIRNPTIPTVADTAWPQSSIDRFVLSTLEQTGLQPSPAADRRTLIRRAYFDLIGLPPSYEDVESFVHDTSADAFARVVDRLLASPRYGERWGRHWLDVARYADTKDGVLLYGDARLRPYAYTYRDYVIRALNEDLPYDQFVQQQLAADLMEPPVEPWQLAALGFLTLGRQFDNNIHDVIDDQIDVTTRGFLGLTVTCARCHDHKYDPIPTADYYSLYGVMASSEMPAELPLIGAVVQTEPMEFEKQLAAKRAELNEFVRRQNEFLTDVARRRTPDYLLKVVAQRKDPLETAVFFLSLAPQDLRPPTTIRWRRLIAERAVAADPVFGPWRDLMEIGGAESDFEESEFALAAAQILKRWSNVAAGTAPGECNPLVLSTLFRATLRNRDDVARAYGQLLVDVYLQGQRDRPTMEKDFCVSARVADRLLDPAEFGLRAESARRRSDPDDESRAQLLDVLQSRASPCFIPMSQTHRHTSRAETDHYWAKLQELDTMAATSPAAAPRAMVVGDIAEPVAPRIFTRGNPAVWGRSVPRQFVAIATAGPRLPFTQGSGRLELARSIVAPDNPLTARVMVNRVWMHHFGEPLVATPSDFGFRSEPPAHPELLDHLAAEFMANGWSLKKLHRWIMLSSVYQMASSADHAEIEKGAERDPENRSYWRRNRLRLDYESVRDALLSVSGKLEHRSGGRPVDLQTQPDAGCRTIYGLVERQHIPGSLRAFDVPAPDQSIERRPRTMTPQQALFALNSGFVAQQSQAVVHRSEIADTGEGRERITALYRLIFARVPSGEELAACEDFLAAATDPQSTLTSWEQLAQVLLCSNEFMYLD